MQWIFVILYGHLADKLLLWLGTQPVSYYRSWKLSIHCPNFLAAMARAHDLDDQSEITTTFIASHPQLSQDSDVKQWNYAGSCPWGQCQQLLFQSCEGGWILSAESLILMAVPEGSTCWANCGFSFQKEREQCLQKPFLQVWFGGWLLALWFPN